VEFATRQEAAGTVVEIAGRLDSVTSPVCEQRIRELMDGGVGTVVLDLARLEYMSSAGLRVLLLTAKLLKAKGGQLRIAGVQPDVRSVFDMSGFSTMFQVEPTVAAALASLA
jgi:stage II sporulation protein AA (anti-sigma F factor antagonist)